MAEDGYEDLDDLKKELSGRKEDSVNSTELYGAVKALSIQIEQLTEIFKLAIGQMTNEDDIMKKVSEQLEQLLKNDQDLARGLLLVLEIEKDRKDLNIDRPLPLRRAISRSIMTLNWSKRKQRPKKKKGSEGLWKLMRSTSQR